MILFDTAFSDIAKNSQRANIFLADIEELYSADFIITAETFPVNLVDRHIESGIIAGIMFAPLGTIYINDVKEFLIKRIDSLKEKGIDKIYIVSTLIARNTLNGNVSFETTSVHEVMNHPASYTQYLEIVEVIADHGAMFSFVPENYIADWLLERETYLKINHGKNKFNTGLQKTIQDDSEIDNDWRKTLATFPLIDYKFATQIRDNMAKKGIGVELFTALEILCNESENVGTKGKALAIHKQARKWIGLPDGWDITVEESKVK
jgi:hypothetical protein